MNLGRVGISYKERLKIFLSWLSFDSGIRSGLDLIRALALGADFVLLGRAFVYGVCALGSDEAAYHAYQILQEELINNMKQLGGTSLAELERVII